MPDHQRLDGCNGTMCDVPRKSIGRKIMVDITKCTGEIIAYGNTYPCSRRLECYRFTAPEDEVGQSWMDALFDSKTKNCDYFLPIQREK